MTRFDDSPLLLGGITGFSVVILLDLIYYNKRIQGKISKEGRGMKSGGSQAPASKSLLVKSHRVHLILSATGCENTCQMLSTKEAH